MNTLSDVPKQRAYLIQFFVVAAMLVFFASSTADRLSGKFFPPDSPILAGLYANDLLPWGMLLLLALDWITVDFVCKRCKASSRLKVFLVLVVIFFTGFSICSKLLDNTWVYSNLRAVWAHYLSRLVSTWSMVWLFGGLAAFSANNTLPNGPGA